MKHLSHRFMLVAGIAMMMLSMVSCKKDKQDNVTPTPTETMTAQLKMRGVVTSSLADVCGVYVDYTLNYGGQNHSDTNVKIESLKTITDIALPCTIDVKLRYKQIGEIDTTINYAGRTNTGIEVLSNTNKLLYDNAGMIADTIVVKGKNMAEWIKTADQLAPYCKISIDAKGNTTIIDESL